MMVSKTLDLKFVLFFILFFAVFALRVDASRFYIPGYGDYEVFSLETPKIETPKEDKKKFTLSSRNALNNKGLGGLFVATTADRFEPGNMYMSIKYLYHKLITSYDKAFYEAEGGSVDTYFSSLTWIGKTAEWSLTVPIHYWELNAPRTFKVYGEENNGLGKISFAWKATNLPDKDYYRLAYGIITNLNTGDANRMLPAGLKKSNEVGVFGCFTTPQNEHATANFELGQLYSTRTYKDDKFFYRFGMTYQITNNSALIGELNGEMLNSSHKDTLDLIAGVRSGDPNKIVIELAYHLNLRNYREYGWDYQLQAGLTHKW